MMQKYAVVKMYSWLELDFFDDFRFFLNPCLCVGFFNSIKVGMIDNIGS